jgi:hypothetical protein
MSSPAVRAAIMAQLAANWTNCVFFDMSDYIGFDALPKPTDGAMLLVQFIGGPERMAAIGQLENHSWREEGIASLHLVFPTGEDSTRALAWGEQLVTLYRGKRFGDLVIDFMEHFSDFSGSAIRIDGRWHGWSSTLGYYTVVCA